MQKFQLQRFVPPSAVEFAAGVRRQWESVGDPTDKAAATAACLSARRAERGDASYRVVSVTVQGAS